MQKYKIETITRRRYVTYVDAISKDLAIAEAEDLLCTGDNKNYDEFILAPTVNVSKVK